MSLTRLLMTIAVIVASIYDLIVVTIGGVDMSLSRWFQTIGYASPFQLIVLGYLLGHFFGYMPFKYRLFKVDEVGWVISGRQVSSRECRKAFKLDQKPSVSELKNIKVL